MAERILLNRGLEADRIKRVFANGEPIFCWDSNQLYVGDGVTKGGIPVRAMDIPYIRSAFSFRFKEYVNVTSVLGALDLVYRFTRDLSSTIFFGELSSNVLPNTQEEVAAFFGNLNMMVAGPIGPRDIAYTSNYTYRVIAYPTSYGVLNEVLDPSLSYVNVGSSYADPFIVTYGDTQFYVYITMDTYYNPAPKQIRYVFSYTSVRNSVGQAPTPITITPNVKTIHQESHGFSMGQWIARDTDAYILGCSDSPNTADVVGLITSVQGTDDFTLTMSGYVSGLSGLVDGYTYFLSDTTPGAMTTSPPSLSGAVNKPVFIADSPTSGFIVNYRGMVN